jgi:hypothetical protein
MSLLSVRKPITNTVTKNITKTINIKRPTLAQYSQLYSTYSETLTCPCTEPSIDYQKFFHIQYKLHEVCNSVFVTDNWISYLAMSTETTIFNDFRSTGPYSFQALATFCDLVENTIKNNLIQFYSNQYVSTSVTPSHLFQLQAISRIGQFRSLTTSSFLLSLEMIRGTIQSNALFSGLQTNYRQFVQNGDVLSSAQDYNGCSCAFSSSCINQSAIYSYPNATRLFNVPGFYTGCYVIESLLQSDLQCFYNQTCINALQAYLPSSSSMKVTALNSSLPSEYSEKTTIKELLNSLMLEQWSSSALYNSYYDECQPIQCTYNMETVETLKTIEMVETRNDALYIAAMLIGVVGGLIAILQLIAPQLAKFIVYGIRKCESRDISKVQIT